MSYSQSNEQARVNNEQQFVKDKAHEAVGVAHQIKEGNVNAELPSNDRVAHALQHGQTSIDTFQSSDRGRQMGAPGQQIASDIKQVLADNEVILGNTNAGDLLQNIIRHFWALLQELRRDPALRDIFEEWQGNFTSLMSSGDFTQFFNQAGELFTSLKDTEEFLELLSMLIDLLKSTVADKTDQITQEEKVDASVPITKDDRDRVINQIKATLSVLTENDTWRLIVNKGKAVGHNAQQAGNVSADSAKQVAYRIKDSSNFQQLREDFRILLQRLAGNQRSVDPLFEYSKGAVNTIIDNDELNYLVNELQVVVKNVTENPQLLDDEAYQQRLDNLAVRAEKAITAIRSDPNIAGLKEESYQVGQAIKNEPASAKLFADLRQLWHDVVSDKPGEVVDADVMKSIRGMIVPLFLEHLSNVPLPSVHDSGKFLGRYEYSIENMKISLPELIPENINLKFEMDLSANPLQLEAENKHTFLYLQASNIHVHLHDANFTYNRLSAPRLHDAGVFDVDTTGNGMTVWMKMEIRGDTSKGQTLEVLKSDVKIGQKFSIRFHNSHHDKLYETLTRLFSNKIKNSVIEMLQEKLKLFGSYFSEQLMALIEQARSKSDDLAKIAHQKKGQLLEAKDQATKGMADLRLQAKETLHERVNANANSADAEGLKDNAKNTGKGLLVNASEKVQAKLDEQKEKIDSQRREKELNRFMDESANTGLTGPAIAAGAPITVANSAAYTPIDHTTNIYPPTNTNNTPL